MKKIIFIAILFAFIAKLCGCGSSPDMGTGGGEKIHNYSLYSCYCGTPEKLDGPFTVEDLPSAKAYWLVFSQGPCKACKRELSYMISKTDEIRQYGIYVAYILTTDDYFNCLPGSLQQYCCDTYENYGIGVNILVDPCGQSSSNDYGMIPYNIIANENKEVVYQQEGFAGNEWNFVERVISENSN